jgi:hypothetical protein
MPTVGARIRLIGVTAVLGVGIAQARECKNVSFPDQIQTAGTSLSLNGLGLRTVMALNVDVYIAALYVSQPSNDPNILLSPNMPSQLTLRFLRDISAYAMRDAWSEGFALNAKERLPAMSGRIATLNTWMTAMYTGQRLILSFRPGVGVTVDVNGRVKGTIEGDDFAQALLSIWLGPQPPNPELKSGLLGGTCG